VREPVLPPGVPELLDQELLAWAAGFFDGEGTTCARTDSRRPDYFQLDVSVPQKGTDRAPQVLLRFQTAMFGVGAIYPEPDGLWKWRAGGRITAEMALALMWPWLGEVKRVQAQFAMEAVDRQYSNGRYKARRPRYRPTYVPHARGTTDSPSLDLAWAAGFLDAEGYFGNMRKDERADGTFGFRIRASATQHGAPNVPADVLVRMRNTLGGRIERHGEIDDHKWVIEGGVQVRDVVERLRPWLGEVKLLQATQALDAHELARVRGTQERCARGHLYDHIYVRPDGTIHRRCNACARQRDREMRLERGGRSRVVRYESPDPTRAYRVK